MEKCWTVRRSSVQRPIMTNVTWSRFDQSAQQLVVGHTTINDVGPIICIFDTKRKNLMLHTFLFNVAQPAFNNTHFV